MAEIEEVHQFLTGQTVLIVAGPYAGKVGKCLGPCACYFYDVYIPEAREMVVLEEGQFYVSETRSLPPEGLREDEGAQCKQDGAP
jgi:hypothetical protein